jgi:hypothetical protein
MFDVDVALDATVDGDDDVSDLAATKRMATRCPGLLREMTWQEIWRPRGCCRQRWPFVLLLLTECRIDLRNAASTGQQ